VLASGAAAGVLATVAGSAGATTSARQAGHHVFQHGVASGDPLPRAVVIWTRVTPTAASTPGSGKGPRVRVQWEVATDAHFRHVVRRGSFDTGPERDHTVKVDVTGLDPARWYHYRFAWDGHTSRVGRTRTAPAHDATPDHLRFGVVSCANLQAGWFSAYRGLAARDDLHAVVHLGDYLYEYGPGQYGYGPDNKDIRKHQPAHEMVSLADYRQRHAQYKADRDLQDAHARYAWIVTWDDHEVANDAWKHGAENHTPGDGDGGEGSFKARRARAHRAYDEWMPARLDGSVRIGDGSRLFRRLRFGTLAELSMLDLRTYRSKQVASPAPPAPYPDGEVSDPSRTITGEQQMDWLKGSLRRHRDVQWKLIGNPVMIAPVNFGDLPDELVNPVNDVTGLLPENGAPYNVDQWDGYTADRRRILDFIRNHQVKDTVFITGDIHSGWAAELPYDASTYTGQGPSEDETAGVEFVCSSVTSNNLKDITGDPTGATSTAVEETIKANNRHVKYLDFDEHGFSVLDLTPERAQMDWFIISDRADRDATIRWTTSYAAPAGSSRVVPVDHPVGA
jgi:alkaline phosphatase D